MGLIGVFISLIGAAFGAITGVMGTAFGVLTGLMGPLAPVLIVFALIFWLAGGTKERNGYVRTDIRK